MALRASRAAIDARFENTNARMLKSNPATEATFPQRPENRSSADVTIMSRREVPAAQPASLTPDEGSNRWRAPRVSNMQKGRI